MRLIGKRTKPVEYFGIMLEVPDTANYIATDSDGQVYSSARKPQRSQCFWHSPGAMDAIATADLDGMDWKETLVAL